MHVILWLCVSRSIKFSYADDKPTLFIAFNFQSIYYPVKQNAHTMVGPATKYRFSVFAALSSNNPAVNRKQRRNPVSRCLNTNVSFSGVDTRLRQCRCLNAFTGWELLFQTGWPILLLSVVMGDNLMARVYMFQNGGWTVSVTFLGETKLAKGKSELRSFNNFALYS